MALDAAMFPQDPFGYNCNFKDCFQGIEDEIGGGGNGGVMDSHSWRYDDQLGFHQDQDDKSLLTLLENKNELESSPVHSGVKDQWEPVEEEQQTDQPATARRKRRRTKACKNKEEVENQRMTHIAVERNRRKQMNEYLVVLRSLMPSSYAQRGDQASIIGGAINFVKELEQLLQTLEAEKSTKNHHQQQDEPQEDSHKNQISSPFAKFFTFPQYTSSTTASAATSASEDKAVEGRCGAAGAADIEVTMVESHANVKILSKRCSRQLVKLVAAFQTLKLTVLHLNMSALDHMVLYSVSIKVEEGCKLNSVDEIAAAVNQMLSKIQEESFC